MCWCELYYMKGFNEILSRDKWIWQHQHWQKSRRQNQFPMSHSPFSHKVGNNNIHTTWHTWKHITLKYKMVKKCITIKYMIPCIPTDNFHTKPIGAEMQKGATKTMQSESANQNEGRWNQVLQNWRACHKFLNIES